MEQNIQAIIEAVLSRLNEEHRASASPEDIPAEISARHVHLSKEDLFELSGLAGLAGGVWLK